MTIMSREANRGSKGLEGRIPDFPKKGKRPGGDKKATARHRWVTTKQNDFPFYWKSNPIKAKV